MIFSINTTSSDQTVRAARELAKTLKPGQTVELVGDLGTGKTTIAKAVINALGFSGEVPSPTFTLSRSYRISDDLVVDHFDLYRLHGHDVVTDELSESMEDKQTITVVEWADHGSARLPKDRVRVELTYGSGEADRIITIAADPAAISKLKQGLR